MKTISHLYPKIISVENLLLAWEEFIKDKKQKTDVRIFAQHLLQNVFLLHDNLTHFTYKHAGYQRFNINDPKVRVIHKAEVRDRIVHHAVCRILYPIFTLMSLINLSNIACGLKITCVTAMILSFWMAMPNFFLLLLI